MLRNVTFAALLAFYLTVSLSNASYPAAITNIRSVFDTALQDKIIDDYSASGYMSSPGILTKFTDSEMSNVIGETRYTTTTVFTGFPAGAPFNFVYTPLDTGNPFYCSGCNGSFLLDFTSTSVGDGFGVFGVGFDILITHDATLTVTFGDNTTQDISIPGNQSRTHTLFRGMASDVGIKTIHAGFPNGAAVTENDDFRIEIDNLTIGNRGANVDLSAFIFVPEETPVAEPSSLAVFALGLLGLVFISRRHRVGANRTAVPDVSPCPF